MHVSRNVIARNWHLHVGSRWARLAHPTPDANAHGARIWTCSHLTRACARQVGGGGHALHLTGLGHELRCPEAVRVSWSAGGDAALPADA